MKKPEDIKILVACEESQAVTIEFRKLGFQAYSCDLQECGGGHPEWHIMGDVEPLLKEHWDLIIAHPPCTYLSASSAVRMYPKAGQIDKSRLEKAMEAKKFLTKHIPAFKTEDQITELLEGVNVFQNAPWHRICRSSTRAS